MPRLFGAPAALVFVAALLLAAPAPAQTSEAHAAAKRKAQGAAASWLALVDRDAFAASWDSAAALLQKRIKRDRWVQQAQRLRDTVRALSARTRTLTQFRDSLQQAPSPGPFVLLKYRSTFEGGRFEELLLTVRQDTTWRVTGYQVTPLRPPVGRTTAPTPDSSGL
jgi:hypothetical protein